MSKYFDPFPLLISALSTIFILSENIFLFNLSLRKDDILPIAIKILDKHNQEGKLSPYLTIEARELLLSHNWPGNVRELENTLQRALVLSNENIIDDKSIMIDKSLSKINESSSIDTFADQLAFAKVT